MRSHPRQPQLRPHAIPLFAGGLLALALLALVPFRVAAGGAATPAPSTTNPASLVPRLHFADAPAQGRQIVSAVLLRPGTGLTDPAHVTIEPPLAMYRWLAKPDLPANGSLETLATFDRYVYPVTRDGQLVKVVSVTVDAATGELKFGPLGLNTLSLITEALQGVVMLGGVQGGAFEVRLLQGSPGITSDHLVLWLKSAPGEADLVYSLTHLGSNVDSLSTVTDFLSNIRQALQNPASLAGFPAGDNGRSAKSRRQAASGEDTPGKRLLSLQTLLGQTLAKLQQKPSGTESDLPQVVANLIQAQVSVNRGLDYLKAHPEADRLTVPSEPNRYELRDDFGYPWRFNAFHRNTPVDQSMRDAATQLGNGLNSFLGNPAFGIACVGDLGGNRDQILRDVAAAEAGLVRATSVDPAVFPAGLFGAGAGTPATVVPTDIPTHLGSISGAIVRRDGRPAADAVVAVVAVSSPNFDLYDLYRRIDPAGVIPALPVTLTTQTGTFVIKDLSPGFYAVMVGQRANNGRTVNVGQNWAVLQVKADQESRLDEPLLLLPRPNGGAQ